jgi:toxin ParE1/3/4
VSGYNFHPEAELDLSGIWDFIAQDSLDAADQVIAKILNKIDTLVGFPDQGHRRPDLTSRPLRFVETYEYLIAYAPEERPLWIIAVIHGRRNPRVIAAILRGREDFG